LDSIKVLLQAGGGVPGVQTSMSRINTNAATTIASAGHAITRASSNVASNAAQSSSLQANVSTVAVTTSSHNIPSTLSREQPVEKRSLRALYAGVTGPLLAIGILQSLNFAIYQRQLKSESNNDFACNSQPGDYLHYDKLSNVAMASFAAGASTSILTSPMLVVKTKQQLMVWGFRKAIQETYQSGMNGRPQRVNGLRNFYTGFGVHIVCESLGRSVYMFTYELLKRKLAQSKCSERCSHYRAGTNDVCSLRRYGMLGVHLSCGRDTI